jgi:hypothetical protein
LIPLVTRRVACRLSRGRIKSVDRTGRHVTLEDGTKLTILRNVKVPKDALKAGAMVTAQYEEKDGQKVVSSIYVKPGPKS